jgi:hypothetical protein
MIRLWLWRSLVVVAWVGTIVIIVMGLRWLLPGDEYFEFRILCSFVLGWLNGRYSARAWIRLWEFR